MFFKNLNNKINEKAERYMKFSISKMIWNFLKAFTFIICTVLFLTIPIQVQAKAPSINLNYSKITLTVGKSKVLKASVTGKSKKITWKSSNSKVASVNSSGTVKGKKAGTATISASANGIKVKCKVTVKQTASSQKLTRSAAMNVYKKVLRLFSAGKKDIYFKGYTPTDKSGYHYILFDINKDKIPELLVGKEVYLDRYNILYGDYCLIFSCKLENGVIKAKQLKGQYKGNSFTMNYKGISGNWYISKNGNGLYCTSFSRGTGKTYVDTLRLTNGIFELKNKRILSLNERSFFMTSVKNPNWKKVSDFSGLK